MSNTWSVTNFGDIFSGDCGWCITEPRGLKWTSISVKDRTPVERCSSWTWPERWHGRPKEVVVSSAYVPPLGLNDTTPRPASKLVTFYRRSPIYGSKGWKISVLNFHTRCVIEFPGEPSYFTFKGCYRWVSCRTGNDRKEGRNRVRGWGRGRKTLV